MPLTVRAFDLYPRQPYDLAATAEYVTQYRDREGTDAWDGEVYRRAIVAGGTPLLASVRAGGGYFGPTARVTLESAGGVSDDALRSGREQVAGMLGVARSPAPFYRLAEGDGAVAPLVRRFHGLHVPRAATLFEAMAWAILGQQISAAVARALRNRVIERFGAVLHAGGAEHRLFPSPAVVAGATIDELCGLGLSARKAEYLRGAAALFADDGRSVEGLARLDDVEAARALESVRGVGPWTAQWLLIRGLGREDALPAGDVALQRVLGDLVNGAPMTPDELLAYAERYRPYRSWLTVYVFALIRSGRASRGSLG